MTITNKIKQVYKYIILLIIIIASLLFATQIMKKNKNKTYLTTSDTGYEILVKSFHDSNGDGLGDIRGLIQKLDYLNDGDPNTATDLGVTALYLQPLTKSPSLHGYDVSDYYNIDEKYGTMADFEELIKKANKRGIKIIFDLVVNHCSKENPWFKKSVAKDPKYDNWFIWEKSTRQQMIKRGWIGYDKGAGWAPHPDRPGDVYYCIFTEYMPDFNYRNQAVIDEMCKIFTFWISKGVHGFRLDAVNHLCEDGPGFRKQRYSPDTYAILRTFRENIKKNNKSVFMLGEADDNTTSYDNGKGMDFAFDFPFTYYRDYITWDQHRMVDAIKNSDRAPIYNYLTRSQNYPRSFTAPFHINHDMARYDANMKQRKAAMALLLTMPGIPFIYYGEEIGMKNGPGGRWVMEVTPMQWDDSKTAGFTTGKPADTDISYNKNPYNVKYQAANPDSLLNFTKLLIQLRKSYPAIGSETSEIIKNNNSSIASYLRSNGSNGVIVIMNLSDKALSAALDFNESSVKSPTPVVNLINKKRLKDIDSTNYRSYLLQLNAYEIMLLKI